ncbi:threonine/homoserine/homoserine lactone efflux protein [Actinoplanes lutulentus]|uniref:Threonine/homoserine/homoserine lactone efflux protein n=1 Tax=Actinoplanes lutulentus TaxID=1287878 RepID=A0A327ZA74_9ACTN|nr:LysE family translocator [Actinoplanes lutulentus]MBB2949097.1 threonine/homoserine/homoserine lactone efflux protein [Actinoplanes lutulentus]RAK31418.1 threonine/homoserine/homoserine lactone efflux protein [Actinoplanes lutulentus]
MSVSSVAAFWAVSFLLVLTPGADWAYAIGAGLRHRTVLPAIAGLLAGYVLVTAVTAAGVAALVASEPPVLTALTVAGAGYLLFLGAGMLRSPAVLQVAAGSEQQKWLAQAIKGLGISGLNPKAILLFLALLPQFTRPAAGWPLAVQIAVLGLVHTASCAVIYTLVSTGSRRVLKARPAAARAVTRVSGAAMVMIGVSLLAEQAIRSHG